MKSWMAGVAVCLSVTAAAQTPTPPRVSAPAAAQTADVFETKIRPLLAANCYACHGEAARAGLRLDSREGMLKGGDTGPVIVPGKPEESTLIKAVQHTDGYPKMPRGRAKLQQADIDVLVEWVRGGAAWPASAEKMPAPVASHERVITAGERAYWAFQPLAKAGVWDRLMDVSPRRMAARCR